MIDRCADSKPSDYDTSAADYCSWTCQDWAEQGLCDVEWGQYSCTDSTVNIKDTCKASCNICGKPSVYS